MNYVKSVLVGFATAVLALVLLVTAIILISLRQMNSQIAGVGAVAGGFTFNSAWFSDSSLFLACAIAFALGFVWDVRRSKRKLSRG